MQPHLPWLRINTFPLKMKGCTATFFTPSIKGDVMLYIIFKPFGV